MRLYLFLPFLMAMLWALPPARAQSQARPDCPEINVKAEITNSQGNNSKGEVLLKFPPGVETVKYDIFLNCLGCVEPKKVGQDDLKDLKPGHYDIYIIDKKGCLKQLNIQVR